jgi:hypothetical protein
VSVEKKARRTAPAPRPAVDSPAAAAPVQRKAVRTAAATRPVKDASAPAKLAAPGDEKTPRPRSAAPKRRDDEAPAPVAAPMEKEPPRAAPPAAPVVTAWRPAPPGPIGPTTREPAPVDVASRQQPTTSEETGELPPPPVAVIRRRPRAPDEVTEPGPRRRGALGGDALAESGSRRMFRSAVDHVVDDLAEQRDRTKQ